MKKSYANKIKERYSNKTKEQLQIIITEEESSSEQFKSIGYFITVLGFTLSVMTFIISQSNSPYKGSATGIVVLLTVLLIVFTASIAIRSGRLSVRKKIAEFELANRKEENEKLQSRNRDREDRLKEKYLLKR